MQLLQDDISCQVNFPIASGKYWWYCLSYCIVLICRKDLPRPHSGINLKREEVHLLMFIFLRAIKVNLHPKPVTESAAQNTWLPFTSSVGVSEENSACSFTSPIVKYTTLVVIVFSQVARKTTSWFTFSVVICDANKTANVEFIYLPSNDGGARRD